MRTAGKRLKLLKPRPIISPVISELSMLSAMSGGSPQRDASDDGAPGAPAPAAQTSPLKKMIGLLRFKGRRAGNFAGCG